jgi:DNA-binding MarR family transcriptional regulator
LTFDLEQFLPYRLYQAIDGAAEAFHSEHLSRFGISRSDWRVLFNIGQYGPLSAIHIFERANLEKTAISRSVQRLVLRGWVDRAYPATDRRRQDLALTAEGKTVFAELRDMAASFNAKLEALLDGDDVQVL